MAKKIIFLDRDGVINKEIGYLHKIQDFIFIDGIFEALLRLQNLGYEFVIVTNQSGIGRGYYSKEDYLTVDKWMKKRFLSNGIKILASFYCPHIPENNCNCRKPKPGMFLDCFKHFNISLKNSWMVGDSEKDIEAANNAEIYNTILVRSGHQINESESNATIIIDSLKDIEDVVKG